MFGIGATFYGSAPLYAPDDKDGTLLLKPGQEGDSVIGEAFAAVRYQDYLLVKGYRQLVDQPYINPIDNRMTPNTFEGLTAGGTVRFQTLDSSGMEAPDEDRGHAVLLHIKVPPVCSGLI